MYSNEEETTPSSIARSDDLRQILHIFRRIPGVKILVDSIFHFVAIADANYIIGDIRWHFINRKKPDARSYDHNKRLEML